MPTYTDEIPVAADRNAVWTYVRDVDNWAHLFPGYQRHLLVEENHFFWQLRGEAGAWSRLVEFDVFVTDWAEPDHVAFELKSRTEPVVGTGRFYTHDGSDHDGSIMGFSLDASATGSAAPMINALLKKFLTEQSRSFLETLGEVVSSPPAGAETTAPAHAHEAPELSSRSAAPTAPAAPGVVVVEYRAPRTAAFEDWVQSQYRAPIAADAAVRRMQRFECNAVGPVVEYRELIDTDDCAATVALHAQRHTEADGDAAGMELTRPPYSARRIQDDRRRRFAFWTRRRSSKAPA